MSKNNQTERDSQWLKHNSQKNRTYRYKQLQFDFGPSLMTHNESQLDHQGGF